MRQICVFGSSSEAIDPAYLSVAEELGGFLTAHDCGVVYGAGCYGIMGAVARGVRAKGGALLGISPDFFVDLNVLTDDYGELILTPTIRERKALMDYADQVARRAFYTGDQTALDFAALRGGETAADLYCGAGTITKFYQRSTIETIVCANLDCCTLTNLA